MTNASTVPDDLEISAEVRDAIESQRGVVALETAVLTHGLPRPTNVDAMRRMVARVRDTNVVPAVVAVIDGRLRIGLDDDAIARLGSEPDMAKLSSRDLAWAMATGVSGGTTVAGTLVACRLAGIRVFATGGIGGVHRGWAHHRDISADLEELARTPCCVVSAGAKAVLDLPATLEALESLGVPVIGWRTSWFPQFYSRGSEALPVPHRADDLDLVARACRARWEQLGQSGGALLANPIPEADAVPQAEIDRAVATAAAEAEARGLRGPAVTPFLLDRVATLTDGRTLAANLALLASNARLAGELAAAL